MIHLKKTDDVELSLILPLLDAPCLLLPSVPFVCRAKQVNISRLENFVAIWRRYLKEREKETFSCGFSAVYPELYNSGILVDPNYHRTHLSEICYVHTTI